jgi:hypothetical protein
MCPSHDYRECRSHRARTSHTLLTVSGSILVAGLLIAAQAWAASEPILSALTGDSGIIDNFGWSVASAGDMNGDGYPDLIVGAQYYNGHQGRAYVYYGGPDGYGAPALVLTGEGTGSWFGYSVASAGDVNGDGYDDVIVGAYGYNASQGRAYVYFGGPGADSTADLVLTGDAPGDDFGYSVSSAGEVNGDGYDDVVVGAYGQDRAYVYYGGPGMDNVADWVLTPPGTGEWFGYSVAAAGDMNNDGHPDVIVGAPNYNSAQGRAYVFYGGAADTSADLYLTGETIGDEFGWSVSSAGDWNGDGHPDVIVGAEGYNANQGRAYVYYGGPAVDATADKVLTGEAMGDYFGWSVSSAGDVNGDHYADVIVGAWSAGSGYGRAYVYDGGPAADTTADLVLTGQQSGDFFGTSVSSAGDVNRDGYGDVIVGAPYLDAAQGRAYVESLIPYQVTSPNGGEQWVAGRTASVRWLGANSADVWVSFDAGASYSLIASDVGGNLINDYPITAPASATRTALVRVSESGVPVTRLTSDVSDSLFTIAEPVTPPPAAQREQMAFTGAADQDSLGGAVQDAGDVNGDSYPDLIVGAEGYNANQGRAYVYYGGPGADGVPDLILTGEATGDLFGASVSSAGDVNGDGYADVIVGARGYNAGQGRAYVYYGGPGADAVPDLVLTGEAPGDDFGVSVSSAGDVNGDGYADLIVGADGYGSGRGRSYLYFGGPGADSAADAILTGGAPGDDFGVSASSAGDVNGDGFADVIVGADGYNANQGRAYVYYAGAGADTVADLVLTGENRGDHFGRSVSPAGDVNGDGYADVIVGAYGGGGGRGRAYVYHGGPDADTAADAVLTGEAAGDDFGVSVSSAGDVNGDGYADVIVGAEQYNSSQGRAYVYYGGPGADAVADQILTGETTGDRFGHSVSSAGDADRNGFAEVLVGAPSHNGGGTDRGQAALFDFNRYFLTAPNGGETWNVGATKTVAWTGAEPADLWLSSDGGKTYGLLGSHVGGSQSNLVTLLVPHSPSRFSRVKVTPSNSAVTGSDASDSTFTIQTSVALLAMLAAPAPGARTGAVVSWRTNPGPADLAGYRLDRSTGSGVWQTLVSLTRDTTYTDGTAPAAAWYRLYSVDGLGEQLMLGEASLHPGKPLAAWPTPYRGGKLTVSFATANALGGGRAPATVSLYDVRGRLVRRIAQGRYGAGYQTAEWDGLDARGRRVPAGIYFLRAESAGQTKTLKLTVLR